MAPWLTGAIPYSDQCGDYRSTSATVFNHEMGRLTELRVKLVLHSEVGSGKGEVDMHFGQKAQQFVAILGRMSHTCAADIFQHLDITDQQRHFLASVCDALRSSTASLARRLCSRR